MRLTYCHYILTEPGRYLDCVRASALTHGKSPGGNRGFEERIPEMNTVIQILISLPEAILALLIIHEKLHKNKPKDE